MQLRAAAALELRRRSRNTSFRDYVSTLNGRVSGRPGLLDYEHVDRLVSVGEKILSTFETDEDGNPTWEKGDGPNYKRVIVMLPPRYYKSEVFSRLLTGCFLRRFPKMHVGLSSYSADLAWKLSASARGYYKRAGGRVQSDTDAKKLWKTDQGGEMWAAGIDGTITGSGFHLGVIDDPMKPKHATSDAFVSAFQSFYSDTWYNRQEPGAAMVVVMQRLGANDPIDYLLRREIGDGCDAAPEHWHIVCCDEIKSDEELARYDGEMGLPPTCTLEHDEREAGEILAPTRFTMEEVEKQQRAGIHAKAQRQQRPTQATGDFWRADWFTTHRYLPKDAYNGGKDWDTAYTKNEQNSACAFIESYRGRGKGQDFTIYIENVDWAWYEFPELVEWMKAVGGPHYIEDKAAGKSAAQSLSRMSISATEIKVDGGDKLARASGVQPVVSQMRISVNENVVDKLLYGKHHDVRRNGRQGLLSVTAEMLARDDGDLDVNDAFVQAINRHQATPPDWSSAPSYTSPHMRTRR